MKTIILLIFQFVKLSFQTRLVLVAENIMLRQQLNIYARKDKKPRLKNIDRIILVWLSKIFPKWKSCLRVAKPATLIGWQKKGFKLFWRWKCRKAGRPCIDWELIKLIRKLQKENPIWSAQRIQGELTKLGFSVCDNTVAKYIKKPKGTPEQRQRWKSFLHNHSPQIIGIDFLVVRTILFKAIYVYIAISHDRRKILHFGVTSKPSSQWAIQQLRETLAFDETTKYIIRDNDKIYSDEFKDYITNKLKLEDTPTTPGSPWQKDYASYCTSLALSAVNLFKSFLSSNFVPCIFTGFSPAMSS
ncbi:MAG: integrase [Phycisphaerae bacterium]|nr:integrase [Phycisphaerae bacterium]